MGSELSLGDFLVSLGINSLLEVVGRLRRKKSALYMEGKLYRYGLWN
jgi:hypothetical protein